jgi:Protein of unknown function (DUF2844)
VKPAPGKAKGLLGWLLAGALGSQVLCIPAFATLGEDAGTVENDRAHMQAQLRTTAVAGYTVHEVQTPTNTLIREYVSAAGKVFAVSWNGPLQPDFQQLFGKYFTTYKSGVGSPRVGRRQVTVEGADLVVHSSGHMRAFHGSAYVPSLLPPNFSVADIQ